MLSEVLRRRLAPSIAGWQATGRGHPADARHMHVLQSVQDTHRSTVHWDSICQEHLGPEQAPTRLVPAAPVVTRRALLRRPLQGVITACKQGRRLEIPGGLCSSSLKNSGLSHIVCCAAQPHTLLLPLTLPFCVRGASSAGRIAMHAVDATLLTNGLIPGHGPEQRPVT